MKSNNFYVETKHNIRIQFQKPLKTRIPVVIKASRVPDTTYILPLEMEKLKEKKMKNREGAMSLYEEAQKKAYRCSITEKSEKYKELIKKIEEEEKKETCQKKIQRKKVFFLTCKNP